MSMAAMLHYGIAINSAPAEIQLVSAIGWGMGILVLLLVVVLSVSRREEKEKLSEEHEPPSE